MQNGLSRAANRRSISPQSQASCKQRCQCCAVRATAAAAPESFSGQLSVYAVSDLHTDYPVNAAWVRQLPSFKQQQEQQHIACCIVAGDISDDLRVLRDTFNALLSKFHLVAFTPGNHEAWVRSETEAPASLTPQQPYLHSDSGGSDASSTPAAAAGAANSRNGGVMDPLQKAAATAVAAAGGLNSRNGGAADSLQKLQRVLRLCDECGVIRQPVLLGGLLLVPLLSWHHKSFDKEADIPGVPRAGAMTIADYSACKWPPGFPGGDLLGSEATAQWFDTSNEGNLQQPGWAMLQQVLASVSSNGSSSSSGGSSSSSNDSRVRPDVISFSHFLPHQHLLPEKRMLTFPNLAKAVGSDYLWHRLQQLQPQLHVFGHSHFAWDAELAGIRFLQPPLCYPAERQHRMRSIKLNTKQELQLELQQQQQPAASIPGHASTGEQQRHGSMGPHKPAGTHPQQQQQQQQPAASIPWLPVKVYEATFRAHLVQQEHLPPQHHTHPQQDPQQQPQQQEHLQPRHYPHPQQQNQQPQQQDEPQHHPHPQQQDQPDEQQQAQEWDAGPENSSSSCPVLFLHSEQGLPVLHQHQLQAWLQQEQQQEQDSNQQPCQQQQEQQEPGPVYLISSWEAQWGAPLHGLWSEYYKTYAREPDNTEMAPWVAKRYKRFRRQTADS